MENVYQLKIYDTPLITFSIKEEDNRFVVQIHEVDQNNKSLLPMELMVNGVDNNDLLKWLSRRTIPKHRAFVYDILKTLGLNDKDLVGIIGLSYCLSLNDSYWVVPESFTGRFADYNLYENPFSEIIGQIAFTGYGSRPKITLSPEFTTGGSLRKCWRRMDDGIYLFKGGTEGFSNTGNEPYNEVYASQIADRMGIDSIHYGIEKWKGVVSSTCKLFTDINTSLVPAGNILKTGGYPKAYEFIENNLTSEDVEKFKDMIVFDSLIYNEDRHFNNFGFLRDNKTGKLKGLAPLYDNGISLFCYGKMSDLQDLDSYRKTLSPSDGISFIKNAQKYIGVNQKEKLRKMINFVFDNSISYKLDNKRIKIIEAFLQHQVQELMRLPNIDYSKSIIEADEPEIDDDDIEI